MLQVQVDEVEVRRLIRDNIKILLRDADTELVFWDSQELARRCSLSLKTIRELFFYDPRFPKHKIGNKWMYPARAAREFLELWLSEQPKN